LTLYEKNDKIIGTKNRTLMNIAGLLTKLSERSGLPKGEILIRSGAWLLVMGFFTLIIVVAKVWLFPIIGATIVSAGFFIGLFRKDQWPLS